MNRYERSFQSLRNSHQIAFVPFTILGYPNKQESIEIIKTFIDEGADMLELGIPYSDPIADGPIIQSASYTALQGGITSQDCFEIIESIREYDKDIPIGLLVYAQVVYSKGIDNFFNQCQRCGVDSVLVADLPFSQRNEFKSIADGYHVSMIFILAPNTDDRTKSQIYTECDAYVYVVSRSGVTGLNELREVEIRTNSTTHISQLLGFGISKVEHVHQAIDDGFQGIIIGSRIVEIIQQFGNGIELKTFLNTIKNATNWAQVAE